MVLQKAAFNAIPTTGLITVMEVIWAAIKGIAVSSIVLGSAWFLASFIVSVNFRFGYSILRRGSEKVTMELQVHFAQPTGRDFPERNIFAP